MPTSFALVSMDCRITDDGAGGGGCFCSMIGDSWCSDCGVIAV